MSETTTRKTAHDAVAALAGVLFGVGLALAGMTRPEKVIGFLDFTRQWDPTLMFVMAGGIAVHTLGYRLAMKRSAPVFSPRFLVPTRRDLDARLLVGSAIFGVGWGLGGFCPGPGLTSLVTGNVSVVAFVVAMLVGLVVAGRAEALAVQTLADRTPRKAS